MTGFDCVRTVPDLRARVGAWRTAGERVALAPTMGALHAGHLSLIALGRRHASKVVASLFVNPRQFGPSEDFEAYPRSEGADAERLAAAGCDLLYAPTPNEIYPASFATEVRVAGLTDALEGAIRPGHFDGVATVVAKLLIQCAPDVAIFGEKDYQQLAVIRRMVRDLDLPVEILGAPIVRDPDGLALSSRNAYLSASQRTVAPALHRALRATAAALASGADVRVVETEAKEAVLAAGFDGVDYVDVREAETLARHPDGPLMGAARLLAAARLGKTRLLDNVAVTR